MGQGTGTHLIGHFPALATTRVEVTSEQTPEYNCIAWAAGDAERWWWPSPQAYWPTEAPRATTVDAFVAAYATLGYERCDSGAHEELHEKIAIYVGADGHVKHAARSVAEGRWTSKLGQLEDIEHELLGVAGTEYGEPMAFMRRRRNA